MSTYDNEKLFDLNPPLPPKLNQKAPLIPPKLNLRHTDIIYKDKLEKKSSKKGPKCKSNSPKVRPKFNAMVHNEEYLFVKQEVPNFDFAKNDSNLIYENKNIIFSEPSEKEIEKKPKSLLSKMKNLWSKKKSKKIKTKECLDNHYLSSHQSERIVSYNVNDVSETSNEMCAFSDINQSWYGSRHSDCQRSNMIFNHNNNQFHVHRPQLCQFNRVPLCQMCIQCHNRLFHLQRHFQLEHLSQITPQIHDLPNIIRCHNGQPCISNTHCHSRVPSFGNFTSFSACSRSLQSNHDRHLIDINPRESIDSITDSRTEVVPNTSLSVSQGFTQEIDPLTMSLHENLQLLRKVGWYWGPLKSDEAEEMMTDRCDGTFIVRDSSHADYLFSITFRVNNNTHHTRIQFSQNKFWLNQEKGTDGFKTVVDLIDSIVHESQNGKFKFFQNIENLQLPTFAVILLYPLSRFRFMTSLKHIARFVIVSRVRNDYLDQLPLPEYLLSYLQDKDRHYVENFYHYVNIMKGSDRLPSIT